MLKIAAFYIYEAPSTYNRYHVDTLLVLAAGHCSDSVASAATVPERQSLRTTRTPNPSCCRVPTLFRHQRPVTGTISGCGTV